MQMFGLCQLSISQIVKGLFHRIKRIALTGKNSELDNFMNFFRQLF